MFFCSVARSISHRRRRLRVAVRVCVCVDYVFSIAVRECVCARARRSAPSSETCGVVRGAFCRARCLVARRRRWCVLCGARVARVWLWRVALVASPVGRFKSVAPRLRHRVDVSSTGPPLHKLQPLSHTLTQTSYILFYFPHNLNSKVAYVALYITITLHIRFAPSSTTVTVNSNQRVAGL